MTCGKEQQLNFRGRGDSHKSVRGIPQGCRTEKAVTLRRWNEIVFLSRRDEYVVDGSMDQ